jgi:hypothetical protein
MLVVMAIGKPGRTGPTWGRSGSPRASGWVQGDVAEQGGYGSLQLLLETCVDRSLDGAVAEIEATQGSSSRWPK